MSEAVVGVLDETRRMRDLVVNRLYTLRDIHKADTRYGMLIIQIFYFLIRTKKIYLFFSFFQQVERSLLACICGRKISHSKCSYLRNYPRGLEILRKSEDFYVRLGRSAFIASPHNIVWILNFTLTTCWMV